MSDKNVFRPAYRPLSEGERQNIEELKDLAGKLHGVIDACATGREGAIAKTKLEEAVMWAVKGATA